MLRATLRILLLGSALFSAALAAESIYVHDFLRLGIRANPNSSESPIAVVTTGAKLEVLERRERYIRVRSEDGVEGWVSEAYVSSDPPASLRLEELQGEYERQLGELDKLREQLEEVQGRNEALKAEQKQLRAENTRLHREVTELHSETLTREEEDEHHWLYRALAIIAIFLLGIILGVRWQKNRVSERIGGLDI
ncbi:MAG: TIGR04211 family SH3 domain-containing protein [Pseudomonadota bacterium]